MKHIIAYALVAAAIVLMVLVARAALARRAKPGAAARGAADEELVAVIAAAIAAASGMEGDSFRIVGFRPASGSISQRGFNTPLWGHIDRSSF